MNLDTLIEIELKKKLEKLIDGLSSTIVELHKKRLGLTGKDLSKEDYILLLREIRESIERFAGPRIANEIYEDMEKLVNKEFAG
ncbi:MAG: hypothetical protein GXO25_02390 [Euryarchaeota archaeon]|nr:hypothetical protein [Euryarchaeota archaeon]